jgi:hypothetical protein
MYNVGGTERKCRRDRSKEAAGVLRSDGDELLSTQERLKCEALTRKS